MQGERHAPRPAECVDPQELGDPAQRVTSAWRHVDARRIEHPLEVRQVIAVLAGRDRHPARAAFTDQSQACEIVGGNRLLEPAHADRLGTVARARAPAYAIRTVRVDEQLELVADRLAAARPQRVRAGSDRPSSSRAEFRARPSRELLLEPTQRVRREPAAARRSGQARAPSPGSLHSGSPSSLAFRSHSARSTAAIAIDAIPGRPRLRIARDHRPPRGRGIKRIEPTYDPAELGLDQLRGRHVRVRVAEAPLAASAMRARRRSSSSPRRASRRPRGRRSGSCTRRRRARSIAAPARVAVAVIGPAGTPAPSA